MTLTLFSTFWRKSVRSSHQKLLIAILQIMSAPSSSRSRARGTQTEVAPDPVTERDLVWKRLAQNQVTLRRFKDQFSQSGSALKYLKAKAQLRNPGDNTWEVVERSERSNR